MVRSPSHDFLTILAAKIEENPANLVFIAISSPKMASYEIKRVRIRPIMIKEELVFQVSSYTKTQSFTVNIKPNELRGELFVALVHYEQLVIRLVATEIHARILGDEVSYKELEHKKIYLQDLSHNRPKKHLLQEKDPSLLLQALGIQTQEGRIIKDKYDKFRQINRFLEIVHDLIPELGSELRIVDFGCGKAYLTFALYQMLKTAHIVGIDARKDLIQKCQELAKRLEYNTIFFEESSIEAYTTEEPVDLVMALHACDTATDDAIVKAIKLQAKALLIAPCCQHEIQQQIQKEAFPLIVKHGLLKERFSALVTDALRAEFLEQMGYSVDICEFVDPEHTPKNLLIRAIRKKTPKPPDWTAYDTLSARVGQLRKIDSRRR